jgi:hypothetical protein
MGFWSVLGGVAIPTTVPEWNQHPTMLGTALKIIQHIENTETVRDTARKEGIAAGEASAAQKYQQKMAAFAERFATYQDYEKTIVAYYAIGCAIAYCDGEISAVEKQELDDFVAGCTAGNLPLHLKETIVSLYDNPPSLIQAVKFSEKANLSKQDIEDLIELVALADNNINADEENFIARWKKISHKFDAKSVA